MDPSKTPESIGTANRRFLLDLARTSVLCRLEGRPVPHSPPSSEVLLKPRGAFVTLKIDRMLRGCIGHVIGVSPLWKSVSDNAAAAAFEDPRFPPLTVEEFAKVVFEISALTALTTVSSEDVVVGRDGILIERGGARGLLLPQVAVEHGWDRKAFLDHTCRKAGIEIGGWRHPDTVISTFSAEVFSEDGFSITS